MVFNFKRPGASFRSGRKHSNGGMPGPKTRTSLSLAQGLRNSLPRGLLSTSLVTRSRAPAAELSRGASLITANEHRRNSRQPRARIANDLQIVSSIIGNSRVTTFAARKPAADVRPHETISSLPVRSQSPSTDPQMPSHGADRVTPAFQPSSCLRKANGDNATKISMQPRRVRVQSPKLHTAGAGLKRQIYSPETPGPSSPQGGVRHDDLQAHRDENIHNPCTMVAPTALGEKTSASVEAAAATAACPPQRDATAIYQEKKTRNEADDSDWLLKKFPSSVWDTPSVVPSSPTRDEQSFITPAQGLYELLEEIPFSSCSDNTSTFAIEDYSNGTDTPAFPAVTPLPPKDIFAHDNNDWLTWQPAWECSLQLGLGTEHQPDCESLCSKASTNTMASSTNTAPASFNSMEVSANTTCTPAEQGKCVPTLNSTTCTEQCLRSRDIEPQPTAVMLDSETVICQGISKASESVTTLTEGSDHQEVIPEETCAHQQTQLPLSPMKTPPPLPPTTPQDVTVSEAIPREDVNRSPPVPEHSNVNDTRAPQPYWNRFRALRKRQTAPIPNVLAHADSLHSKKQAALRDATRLSEALLQMESTACYHILMSHLYRVDLKIPSPNGQ